MHHQKEKYLEDSANEKKQAQNISNREFYLSIPTTAMNARTKVPREPKKDCRVSVGYIGSMSRELAAMARNEGCGLLGYMLEVAAIEAERMVDVSERQSVS
jgi:hypothetical protein